MAALHLTDKTISELTPAMLSRLSKHVCNVLPVYARPRFIRVQKEPSEHLTSTFKQQKSTLVKEGFSVDLIKDPMYYLNLGSQTYLPLDHAVYARILAGNVPL